MGSVKWQKQVSGQFYTDEELKSLAYLVAGAAARVLLPDGDILPTEGLINAVNNLIEDKEELNRLIGKI